MSFLRNALGAMLDRVPGAGGRVVKELAQSVERTSGYVERRAKPGFFRRIAEAFTGKVQTQINRNLVGTQREIVAELDGMRARGIAVDVDVARVAGHLREVQYTVQHTTGLARRNAADIADLARMTGRLGELVALCQDRLDEHDLVLGRHALMLASHAKVLAEHSGILAAHTETLTDHAGRLEILELRAAATEAFTLSTERWSDGETYTDMPWAIQVLLLAQEVASGPSGAYELMAPRTAAGMPTDPQWFQKRLVRTIIKATRPERAWEGRRPFVDVLAEAISELGSEDERMMVAELLGVGLTEAYAPLDQGPLSSAFAVGLDQPPDTTRAGLLRLAGRFTGSRWVPNQLTAKAFVERAVAEQSASALAARAALWRPPRVSGEG